MNLVWVFVGGGLGSSCRYGIARLLAHYNLDFPIATFLANIISCVILGYLVGLTLKEGLSENMKLLLMTGFCGGFSTFSTYSSESFQLLQNGNIAIALLYIGLSIVVCLICIWLGIKLAS